MWKSAPAAAWRDHILPATKSQTWIEDSSVISDNLKLSKRELFALINLAHMQGKDWFVGYDENDGEPNDGFVSDGVSKINVECKLIPQMSQEVVLNAILETYEKYRRKGASYGQNRTLIIHANKGTRGLIKISDLRDAIEENCPFDRVLLLSCVSMKKTIAVMHITQHFPKLGPSDQAGQGIAQVDLDLTNGEANVPHVGLDLG